MTNDILLHKWIEGTLTDEELSEFKKRPEYPDLVQVFQKTEFSEPEGFRKNEILRTILSEKNKKDEISKSKIFRLSTLIKIASAAAVLLIFSYVFLTKNTSNQTIVISTQKKNIQKKFKDGSICTLYKNSEVKFNEGDWRKQRMVELKGKATFNVANGNAFYVQTKNARVEVLGTIFTVDEIENQLLVNCSEGKVKISAFKETFNEVISASEKVWIDFEEKSWITNKATLTKLKNVNMETVMNELEKQFSINFKSREALDLQQKINCNFQHNNLKNALQTTLVPFGLKYSLKNNTVILD